MADRPIIFSGPMVRALLDGRKTQTRRVLKPQPVQNVSGLWVHPPKWTAGAVTKWGGACQSDDEGLRLHLGRKGLPYAPGDRLYVREAFNSFQFSQDGDDAWPVNKVPTLEECMEADELGCRYGAPQIVYRESERARQWFREQKWRSPIHMPRWASRLTLTVTDVRVQRLQEISEADARAEGCDDKFAKTLALCDGTLPGNPRVAFHWLWNSLHGPDAWDANPWVVALTFTVQRGNIDEVAG